MCNDEVMLKQKIKIIIKKAAIVMQTIFISVSCLMFILEKKIDLLLLFAIIFTAFRIALMFIEKNISGKRKFLFSIFEQFIIIVILTMMIMDKKWLMIIFFIPVIIFYIIKFLRNTSSVPRSVKYYKMIILFGWLITGSLFILANILNANVLRQIALIISIVLWIAIIIADKWQKEKEVDFKKVEETKKS